MSDDTIEYPFDHPACKEARQLFRRLDWDSEEDFQRLPRRDRYLWDVSCFEFEVMNGGIDQYLHNPAGGHCSECLDALKSIGAEHAYRLLKQACDLFPEGKPSPSYELRQSQLREITGDKFLDDVISGEIEVDLYARLLDYYRQADASR